MLTITEEQVKQLNKETLLDLLLATSKDADAARKDFEDVVRNLVDRITVWPEEVEKLTTQEEFDKAAESFLNSL